MKYNYTYTYRYAIIKIKLLTQISLSDQFFEKVILYILFTIL